MLNRIRPSLRCNIRQLLFFLLLICSVKTYALMLEHHLFPTQKGHPSLEKIPNPIVISGKPVELKVHKGYFSFPESYTLRREYHFVTYLDTQRVCFLHQQPELVGLDRVEIMIYDHGKHLRWECYRHDPRYFLVDY